MDTISVDGSDGVKIVISDDISVSEFAEWLIASDLSDMNILVSKTTADNLRRSFPLNSKIKEILEQHNATLYLTEEPSLPTTVIDGNQAHYYVRMGNVRRFVKLSDDEIGSILTDEFESLLEAASRVDIDTPVWSELLAKLESVVGLQTRSEFEQLIEAAKLEEMDSLDAVSVALIAAAQSGALSYDLGKWAEETGVASKATISRRKTALETDGVIYTEKVPVEVGRPRQRLLLADDISAVRIDTAEVDVSRKESTEPRLAEDEPDSTTVSEQGNQKQESDQDEITSAIEQEIQDVISSE
ncbi:transcriptional regulator TbsP domain-containing protein [Halorubrum distributum]|uniref:transcriptional regulator TbsP domain-containing protein n=1 Tax=Halorubrum distributum TaxID=29283 RepID=UPI0012673AEE|nr:DUF5821 family protein [Halorubrum distributum]